MHDSYLSQSAGIVGKGIDCRQYWYMGVVGGWDIGECHQVDIWSLHRGYHERVDGREKTYVVCKVSEGVPSSWVRVTDFPWYHQ